MTRRTRPVTLAAHVRRGTARGVGLLVGEATSGEATALVALYGDPARPTALVARTLVIEVTTEAGIVTTVTWPLAPLVAEAFAAAKAGAR